MSHTSGLDLLRQSVSYWDGMSEDARFTHMKNVRAALRKTLDKTRELYKGFASVTDDGLRGLSKLNVADLDESLLVALMWTRPNSEDVKWTVIESEEDLRRLFPSIDPDNPPHGLE